MAIYEKKKWEESDSLKKQQQALEAYKATKPADYTSENKVLSAEALKNWQNYKPFSYDVTSDLLYNQYKNNYMNLGKMAMQDTMGQAAALTGGYGSSYMQNVGQQAYQGYLQKLNDVVPQLYDSAYGRYQQDKNDAYANWQTLQALEEQDYNRYMDEYNKFNAEYDRLLNEYNTAYDREYNQYQYEDQMDYQRYQDELAQENWLKQFEADEAYRNWQMRQSSGSSSPKTVTTAYDNGNVSTGAVKEIQAYLGVPQTGYWDEVTYRAAGGLTADEAYYQYNNTYNDIETDELYRTLMPDTEYLNNYYAQTPTTSGNNVYQYTSDMYKTSLTPLSDSQIKTITGYLENSNDDYKTAEAVLDDWSGQGYDVSQYYTLLNYYKKFKPNLEF